MIGYIILVTIFAGVRTETNTGSCKDMLQGYLTGQLSSALGTYQVEALRREFKSFTDIMEKSMKTLKEEVQADIKIKGTCITNEIDIRVVIIVNVYCTKWFLCHFMILNMFHIRILFKNENHKISNVCQYL